MVSSSGLIFLSMHGFCMRHQVTCCGIITERLTRAQSGLLVPRLGVHDHLRHAALVRAHGVQVSEVVTVIDKHPPVGIPHGDAGGAVGGETVGQEAANRGRPPQRRDRATVRRVPDLDARRLP
jgi:hypothetical protein